MTLALLRDDVAERLTDREWSESAVSTTGGTRATLCEEERTHRFRCRGGEIIVTVPRDMPRWMLSTAEALSELLSLPEDWDSYGAPRIDPVFVPSVLCRMLEVMDDETPPPAVVPTSRGGVQLEWHTRGIDLEVEFVSPTRVRGFYEDLRSGQTWEKELTFDLDPLAQAIAQLTQRTS